MVVPSFSYAKVWAEYLYLEAPVVLESGALKKPIETTDWAEFVSDVTGRKKTTILCSEKIEAGTLNDVFEDAADGAKY